MAPPLLTLTDIALGFGGRPLFQAVDLMIQPGERLCVVGRNGSGKSTLMKIAAGLVEPDRGERFVRPGTHVAYLPQEPDLSGFASLADYAAAGLPETEAWRAAAALEGLKVAPNIDPSNASGGERRRAALARLIAAEPQLMLLDEPTNHLDITAIEWLEKHLDQTKAAFAMISHDRAILSRLTRATIWIDRGEIRRSPRGFARFEAWRDEVLEREAAERHKLDRLIRSESHWAAEGISARRTRNQGRLRRLVALKAERRAQIARTGTAAMELESGAKSGKLVIEAEGVTKGFGEAPPLVRDFSVRIARGERVALVGPNGVGKTTLLNVLIGKTQPDHGTVRLGANLEVAVFDQNRTALQAGTSLWSSLTGDAELGVKGNGDQVMVRGRPRHVVAYLKDFLFDERQARGPVSALSGGERARLLLARIMARRSNLLVLDEPTNDLDVETLDLLQELIADFDGTVVLISHDRDFLDRVATTTIAMEGDGRAVVYAGGWSDYRAQRGETPVQAAIRAKPAAANTSVKSAAAPKPRAEGLSFTQEKRLDDLPPKIDRLTAEIGRLEEFLADPELFTREPAKFTKVSDALAERQEALATLEEEWLELESLREGQV